MGRLLLMLVLIINSLPVAAELSGRLFTTPEERAQLRRLRQKQAPTTNPQRQKTNNPIIYNGAIINNNRSNTVWLNDNIRKNPRATSRGLLVITKDGKKILLKPGQTYDPIQQRVIEAYQK